MPATRAGWARAGQRAHHLLGRDVPIPLPSAEKSGGGRREPMRPRKPQAGHHRRQVLPGHRPMDQMAVPGNGRAEVDGQRGANHGQNLGGFSSTLKVEGGKKKISMPIETQNEAKKFLPEHRDCASTLGCAGASVGALMRKLGTALTGTRPGKNDNQPSSSAGVRCGLRRGQRGPGLLRFCPESSRRVGPSDAPPGALVGTSLLECSRKSLTLHIST